MSSVLIVGLPLLAALVTVLDMRTRGSVWLLISVVLAQSLALLWSRRFPLTVLIVVTTLEAALVAANMELLVGFLAAACGLGAWAGHRRQRAGLALTVGMIVALVTVSVVTGDAEPGPATVGSIALIVLFAGFWGVGRLSAHHLHYSRQLEEERAYAEQRAAERERVLLARELHDILNHTLTAMVLDADATSETGDEAELREALRRQAGTGRQSLAELRRLLGVLRTAPDSILHDPLAVLPGLNELDALLSSFGESGPRVRLKQHGTFRHVDASVGQAAYRVVQESLTNVGKHAGPVDTTVSLAYAVDALTVRVTNAPPLLAAVTAGGGGLGLIGMRERVELVGGTLTAGHRAGGGFEVSATFPTRSAT
ncbi:sensor histidine kinase [Streptomyces chartreusis]|uniref:sensor histidine kinase n=1 Tax=Streptomyces chartreusis TaxID=1969 RepID=UPI00367531B2